MQLGYLAQVGLIELHCKLCCSSFKDALVLHCVCKRLVTFHIYNLGLQAKNVPNL